MTLITPNNLQYIVSISILSRIIIIAIQLVSNIIIPDHSDDAYNNKYFLELSTNGTNHVLPEVYWYFYKSIEGFTKWDAQYFLEISKDGYISEKHLAFLPLFPISISFFRQIIFKHSAINFDNLFLGTKIAIEDQVITTTDLQNYIRSALVGCALNNFIFFPIASISLFALTKLFKKDERYAKNVVWWFCFNPASIFFSACYTESLFSALTFTTMFVIEYKAQSYLSSHEENSTKQNQKETYKPLQHLNRLLYICLPCLALIALSSATRSNGLVTIGFLGYQFLLKYAPLTKHNRSGWSLILYISTILECVQDVLVLLISSVIAASGYITFQIYSYIKFCLQEDANIKGALHIKPAWCDNLIPHPYGQVQAKYWNVGLFRYYQIRKLPNFLLAFPISYLVLVGSLKKSRNIARSPNGKEQLVYYLQAITLTIFCGISINVEVTTRLLASSCPVIYWICTDVAEQSRLRSKILIIYFISYFIIGTILHSNFYPWT